MRSVVQTPKIHMDDCAQGEPCVLEDDQFDPVEQHAQHPAQLQGVRARVHRENHSLPLRKGVATPAQVAATENALSILLRLLRNSRLDPSLLRAGLTIRLMLDLGRSAAQLSGLRRISLASEKSCPAAEWGLVAWANEGSPKFGWWLPAGVHTDPKRADIADRGAVWLPLLERTKPWLSIAGLLEDCCEPSPLLAVTPREAKLDAAAFQAWAKATLGPFARALPRVDRLPGTVIEKLAWAATGDRTLGKQIAGQDLEHSAARSYYTSLSVPKAAMLYAKAIASPVSDLSLVAQADNCGRIAIPSFAGSAFTRASESGRVCDIRSTLELLGPKPDQRQNDSELITSHNKLVARLWILLALSTATRSVIDWVPGLRRVEPRTGGLIVLDKDRTIAAGKVADRTLGTSLGRARLVFLPPAAQELLRFYIDHLRTLSGRSSIHRRSKAVIDRHIKGLEADDVLPFLILQEHPKGLAEKGLVVRQAKVFWLKEAIAGLADVPANFARHTLRSGLVGHLPHSVIDAWLGHFDLGTEPWSNGSAFDPSAYRALLNVVFEAHFQAAAEFDRRPVKTHRKDCSGRKG